MKRATAGSSLLFSLLALAAASTPAAAQTTVSVAGREVQLHGFLSAAFAWTDENNFLRMTTNDGSVFGEAGANVSASLTSRLRVGAQVYVRDIGELGNGHVYLDWASLDFRFKDWLGVRGGKVKTTLGLYMDTQDQEFLHTWALLPQGVYPTDLRSTTVAHTGADVYGHVDAKRAGVISYTVFGGRLYDDKHGGYRSGIEAQGVRINGDIEGRVAGLDVRWDAPLRGLTVGASYAYITGGFKGTFSRSPAPLSFDSAKNRLRSVFAEYTRGGLHLEAEYRSHIRCADVSADTPTRPVVRRPGSEEPAWFATGAYRFSKWVEAGTYYSHYKVTLIDPVVPVTGPGRDHIYDTVGTLRIDLTPWWAFKIEGHFMDGVGSPAQAHGFYPQDNPGGFKVTTRMFIMRSGWYF